MSDNVRRFQAVRSRLLKDYPGSPSKRRTRHLSTLAGLVAGIVAAGSTHLSKVAQKAPDQTKTESRVKRFSRFIDNKRITMEAFFMPYAQALIDTLSENQPLLVVFDASAVGRGCATLMASVVYGSRALPVAWLTKRGKKGHFSAEDHVKLLGKVRALVPDRADVILLGDGEFDSLELQRALDEAAWHYVCRTAVSTLVDDGFTCCKVGDLVPLVEERYASLPAVSFTGALYGPVHLVVWHEARCDEPIYLVTSMNLAEEAIHYYGFRFRIETFFSDQKSRGFHLHKSHLSDPERLSRLMMASSLAYLWMIYLGVESLRGGWYKYFHRTDRIDLSLFQLGLRLMEYLLNQGAVLLVAFKVLPVDLAQSVR
ncbi:MAG TPA: transposase [Rhodothermales bacterium]|nr:transposase [Rhodothermales bacterium]